MTRVLGVLCLTATLMSTMMIDVAQAQRGGVASENPWAAEHIEGLPIDIRKHVEGHARECGNPAAAAHYFSVSIEASGRRFYAQHFEELSCNRRAAVCRPEGCLHEVFLDNGGRQRQVFSIYARDIKLTNDGGTAGIEVVTDAGVRRYAWNGRRFVANGKSREAR